MPTYNCSCHRLAEGKKGIMTIEQAGDCEKYKRKENAAINLILQLFHHLFGLRNLILGKIFLLSINTGNGGVAISFGLQISDCIDYTSLQKKIWIEIEIVITLT